ncbi:hypothetical protein [uncultured Enterovirga sp.]|uniref:hypothetical protein n=1 Tax=uncultured Enterovirga sp. TaxID=2026352 RepID=UPI0035CC0464
MNPKVLFLVAGLVVGALLGYFTRPDSAELKLGPVSIEVQSGRPAAPGSGGQITTGQWQHIGAFALGGAVLGLLGGFVVDRRRI